MKKVLYIDDDAEMERMASKFEIMREENIDVVPIARVRDVLPTLKSIKDSIGLIVLDLIMPTDGVYTFEETDAGTLTGLRLLEDIRQYSKDIPVIIVSVRRNPSAKEKFSQYGISDYLEKPVSTSYLVEVIRKYLK
jgi:two-component system OmpR family response regulator